jgi:hypothetical protein
MIGFQPVYIPILIPYTTFEKSISSPANIRCEKKVWRGTLSDVRGTNRETSMETDKWDF